MNKNAANFNWDVFLDRVAKKNIILKSFSNKISILTSGYEEERNIVLDSLNAKSSIFERKQSPNFEIDEGMLLVLQGIGFDYMNYKAEREILKFIKLPYPAMNLQYARHNHGNSEFVLMKIMGPMELDPNSEFESERNENINFQHIIVQYEGKDKSPMVLFDQTVKGIYLDKFSDNAIHETNVFEMDDWKGPFPTIYLLEVIIGLCIALNTKQLYREENILSKKSTYEYSGMREIIRENGYKKLTLSLKGKQHLEYMYEKRSGSKNKSRLHLRRGHFKQRKTGLFWWNPHIAGKESEYTIEKSYKIK